MSVNPSDAQMQSSIVNAFKGISVFRLGITAVVLIWAIVISVSYSVESDAEKRENIRFIQQVWFGNTTVFSLLFWLWVVTVVAFILFSNFKSAIPSMLRSIRPS